MSAQALLSVSAPAVTVAPRGAASEAASGFQSLLAALTTRADEGVEPGPVVPAASEVLAEDDAAPTGFLIPPPLLPAPPVSPVLPADSDQASRSSAFADGTPVEAEPSGTTPLPVDKAVKSGEVEPPVQPAEPDLQLPARATSGETPLTLAEAAAVTEAAETRARVVAALTTPSPPPPPPLRPLAERTSRPADGPSARTVEASVGDAIKPSATPAVSTAAPTAGTGTDRPPVAEPFAALLAADTGAAADAEDQAARQPPAPEPTPTQTSPGGGLRDAGPSTLSRATIEATAQIAAQILRRLEGRSTRFEMALTPDDLGRVDVKLDIDSEGRLNARLAFDNPLAAADMKGRVDDLRRQLEDAGFHLADDAFEFTDRDRGSSAFDRGQSARDGQSRAFAAASRLNDDIDLAQPPRWLALSLSPSGVDMKV